MDLKSYLKAKRKSVEQAMTELFPDEVGLRPDLRQHIEAMRYSLFAGGKRVRPILCIAACEAVGGEAAQIMPAAVSLECIHTYSLIHDDLPAMDDDELRRGKPTSHMVYGEAGAILAGDGLLTLAFDLLSGEHLVSIPADDRIRVINIIATGSGSLGMVGGQALDIGCEGRKTDIETLREIHSRKTGALITASVQTGAVLGGADRDQFAALTVYGEKIGLAFQIVDDLLNVEGTTEQLGKSAGSDAEREKATYPAFFGVDGTRRMAEETVAEARDALAGLGDNANMLRDLAKYIYTRSN